MIDVKKVKLNNSVVKKSENRIAWIDSAKGVGVFFVMLGHCYLKGQFTFWFYSFHMALFFFLSGYTFSLKKQNYMNFFWKKVKTLLVPYVFFVIVTMCVDALSAVTHGRNYNPKDILLNYLVQNRYTLLWFLTCLFIAEQIIYWLVKLSRKFKANFWLVLGTFFAFVFYLYRVFVKINLPWNADISMLGASYMCLGIWVKQKIDLSTLVIKKKKLYLGLFIISFIVAGINYYFWGNVDWYSNEFGNPVLSFIASITGVLTVVFFCMQFQSSILAYIGQYSLLFYALHRIVIDLLIVVYGKLRIPIETDFVSFVMAMVSVILSIAILYPVNYIILRCVPWCLGKSRE